MPRLDLRFQLVNLPIEFLEGKRAMNPVLERGAAL
jgi:Zn-dependent membrane protease YugP